MPNTNSSGTQLKLLANFFIRQFVFHVAKGKDSSVGLANLIECVGHRRGDIDLPWQDHLDSRYLRRGVAGPVGSNQLQSEDETKTGVERVSGFELFGPAHARSAGCSRLRRDSAPRPAPVAGRAGG